MRKCAKYIYIAYYSMKQTGKYKANNVLSVISSIIFMAISYHIWSSVYAEQSMDYILELHKTLTYVVVIAILNQGICTNVEMEIGNRVITGDIAVDLIRPTSYFKYIFFNRMGKVLFNVCFLVFPLIVVALAVFKIEVQWNLNVNLYFIISVLLSIILVFMFEFILGLVSFTTNQIFGVSLLKTAVYNVCSGIVIPLSFYPEALGSAIINLPFQAMFFIPVSIYCGIEPPNNVFQHFTQNVLNIRNINDTLLFEQVIWIFILFVVYKCMWAGCMKKLVVQGG